MRRRAGDLYLRGFLPLTGSSRNGRRVPMRPGRVGAARVVTRSSINLRESGKIPRLTDDNALIMF